MEVHHHSHSARKKWTHYFWEFLMLFLAVFCGFLAEYQLEHTIEHKREKQYIKSFVEDLKRDTAALDDAIRLRSRRVRLCDSLVSLLKSPDREKYTSRIYSLGLRISSSNRFSYTDRTIQQLRNAGGMRLIRAKGASDSILVYDIGVRRVQTSEDQSFEVLKEYRAAAGKVFDASVFQSMIDSLEGSSRIRQPVGNPKLLTENSETINNLCIQTLFYLRYNNTILSSQRGLLETATRIIGFLEKKYHIK